MQADIVIKNGKVLTMDDKFTIFDRADVAVKDGKIVDISPQTRYTAKKTIDAQKHLVMPGLINVHTHAAMVMLRGIADDMPLDIWLQKYIFPLEAKLVNPEFIRIGAALAAVEMIKSGTTSFSDMYFFQDVAAGVFKKAGIRSFLGEVIFDFPSKAHPNADENLSYTRKMYNKWKDDPIVHLTVDPHAPYTCGEENLLKSKKLADELGLLLHIHVSETAGEVAEFRKKHGMSPVKFLDKIGFLGENVIAVHCVHLDHDDMKIFAQKKVKVAHCQESNMKLASGSAPIVELQDMDVLVGLGTDGAASNNNLDMFDEMDSVAKYHKAVRSDPTVMPAKTVVKMATRDGAGVLRRPDLGTLEVGKTADIILVNLKKPHLTPLYNIYSHLVYSAGGSEVDSMIVNGKLIMENNKVLTMDENEIMEQANQLAEEIKNEIKKN